VRSSGFGYVPLPFDLPPLPVPAIGVFGFLALLAASLYEDKTGRDRPLLVLAWIAGATGGVLFLLQIAVIRSACWLCVVVDLAALIALGTTLLGRRAATSTPRFSLRPWGWLALSGLLLIAPFVWKSLKPAPPVPGAILAFYEPGKINVVEFADFQCPFCRVLHQRLKALIEDYPGQVHFVRLNMPLKNHNHARDAARVAVCAEAQGRGEPVADFLFKTQDLRVAAIVEQAKQLGLDRAELERCMNDPKTDARIDRESDILREVGFEGLPTTYVGEKRVVGAQPEPAFRDAFDDALRREPERSVSPLFYLLGLALCAAALVVLAREPHSTRAKR
jgi:predicted DsbA family dithiol-disulfide isomerase